MQALVIRLVDARSLTSWLAKQRPTVQPKAQNMPVLHQPGSAGDNTTPVNQGTRLLCQAIRTLGGSNGGDRGTATGTCEQTL